MAAQVSDETIRQLTQDWVATLPDQYPEPKRPHRFSLRFHWKMRSILRQARKQEAGPVFYRGMRFAAAVLVAALMTFTVAMAVPAVREKVFQMVREVHKQYSRISYEQVGGDEEFGEFVPYSITYVPEGFTLEEDRISEISHNQTYFNEEGLAIGLDQTRIDRASFSIDTEDDEPVQIMLNGDQPAWYLDNGTLQVIYWDDGTYSFHVATNLSKEESIKVAESVAPKRTEEDEEFGEFVPYYFTYIPEGFTLEEDRISEISHNQTYFNEEGLVIGLDQTRIDKAAFTVDTEHVEPVEIMLNGDQPAWYLGNPTLKVIYWDDGTYSFCVVAHLSKEEIIKIAESLSPK